MTTATVSTSLIDELVRALPEGSVIDRAESMERLSRDHAEGAPVGRPAAVVLPTTTEHVRRVVTTCYERRVPVVTRGAGTGLSGGANAVDGCVVVSLERMDRILEINTLERLAVVEPGVVNDDLRAAVGAKGLWYPPDPASSPWSTIGGNVATNAGGVCCVKYGVTGDYVLALEVVTATGAVLRVGRRTAKGVAGYDLTSLMVGSEGTLGIITEITVRLRPLPSAAITVAGFFPSIAAAGEAVRTVLEAGVTPSALELVDRHCLEAVDRWKSMGLSVDAEVVLLGQVDEPGEGGERLADLMKSCFTRAGATWADRSTDPQEADALFAARRLAYPALERLGPVLTMDVCVPTGAVPDALTRIETVAERHDVLIANVAHAGDGNLHPMIVTSPGDEAAGVRAEAAHAEILDLAVELGGTVTGEHGVGLIKRQGLAHELTPDQLALHRAVKQALDPAGILNPGKVFL
ncbi:MAG: FAD-linked oxidase C-terminal domain-containing protein [Nocardioides sp.]